MDRASAALEIFGFEQGEDVVLRPKGHIDADTYPRLRDAIIRAALGAPRAVVVNVTALTVTAVECWTVFPLVRWQINLWPEVPVLVVCGHGGMRAVLERLSIAKYAAVFDTEAQARETALAEHRHRRRRARMQAAAEPAESMPRIEAFVATTMNTRALQRHCGAVADLVTAIVQIAGRALPGPGCSLVLERDDDAVVAAVTRGIAGPAEHFEDLLSTEDRALLNDLSRLWGHTAVADEATLWAVAPIEVADSDRVSAPRS